MLDDSRDAYMDIIGRILGKYYYERLYLICHRVRRGHRVQHNKLVLCDLCVLCGYLYRSIVTLFLKN